MVTEGPTTVDEYIAGFPEEVRAILTEIRRRISALAPHATESISYRIPTFKVGTRPLVYFAGFAGHVSVYPIPDGPASFEELIRPYRAGKGTLRFPLDRPIPYDVIEEVTRRHLDRFG